MAGDDLYQRFGRDFPTGHVLFRDGDDGHEMFVVQSGKIRISKSVRDVEKTLVVLGAGEFFGEMSILNNQPRSATATIDEDAKLLVIDPKTFEAMVRHNAEIAVRMIKKLAARLQEADEQIENLLLRDYNSRVVHFLAHNAGKLGKPAAEGGVNIEMNAKDLGGKLGLDLEPVQEVIGRLVRAKLVAQDGMTLRIFDVAKLQAFLGFLEMKEKFGDV